MSVRDLRRGANPEQRHRAAEKTPTLTVAVVANAATKIHQPRNGSLATNAAERFFSDQRCDTRIHHSISLVKHPQDA